MTKTQRRRATRTAQRQATVSQNSRVPLNYTAAAKLLRDACRWKFFDEALRGLLAVEFTNPFIDTERNCPEEAYLIVHLDFLRGPENIPSRRRKPFGPSLQQRVERALDAVAALCATAQCMSRWDDFYIEFWKSLGESDAMMSHPQPSAVDKWVRFTRARCIPLLLSWCDKPFVASHLMEPLRTFLATPLPHTSSGTRVSVEVGLRFESAAISTAVLEGLHELLVVPTEGTGSLLVEPVVLRTLWFSSNPFYAPELNALADILSDPATRRVDDLRLNGIITASMPAVTERAFVLALSRVLTSAFTIKSITDSSQNVPLSLALAGSYMDTQHVDALRAALSEATRPLCGLDLTEIRFSQTAGWNSLAQLIFTPLPTATPNAVLNLSHLSRLRNLFKISHHVLARDTINRMRVERVFEEEVVECCLSDAVVWADMGRVARLDVAVPTSERLKIHEMDPETNLLRLTVSAANPHEPSGPVSGWVDAVFVTELYRNGIVVVGSSFKRLIADDNPASCNFPCLALVDVTLLLGPRLKFLSLRNYRERWTRLSPTAMRLPEILSRCLRLEGLSLEGTPLVLCSSAPFWESSSFNLPRSLQILSLDQCGLRDTSLRGLDVFPLRHLSLLGNAIGADGVESLLGMLRVNDNFQLVELNAQSSEPGERCVGLRSEITSFLNLESLQPRGKAAVLSVLAPRTREAPPMVHPGNDVVALIFAFVGTRPSRVVTWSS